MSCTTMKTACRVFNSELMQVIASHPSDSPALNDGADRQFRYGDVVDEVDQARIWLAGFGMNGVAICAENGPAQAIADLACLESGIWSLAIPPFFTPDQTENALKQSGCRYLLSDRQSGYTIDSTHIAGDQYFLSLTGFSPEQHDTGVAHPGTAKVTFTSGSTGNPKGLCISEEQLLAPVKSLAAQMNPLQLSRHISILPLAVLLENVAGLYNALWSGVECVLPPCTSTYMMPEPLDAARALTQVLYDNDASSAILVPELLKLLVIGYRISDVKPQNLRYVAVGGSKVSNELLHSAQSVGIPAYEGYGLSEACSVVSLSTPELSKTGSVGKVLDHQSVSIADDGEIVLHNSSFIGYCGRAGTQRFAPDVFYTGDIGRIDADGFLYVNGRKKNVLITSMGRNVSPEWVEAQLLHQNAVQQVCVFGDAQATLSAVIVCNCNDASADHSVVAQVVNAANSSLPDYAQIAQWQVVPAFSQANGLLTGNGKLRREHIEMKYAGTFDHT